jgi:hypothetical protein
MKKKTYEVIIDLGSKTIMIEAECQTEAENKAMEQFETLPLKDRVDEYWVGDCTEVEDDI